MRRLVAMLLAVLGLAGDCVKLGARRGGRRRLGGESARTVTFVVRTGDRLWGRGLDQQFPMASVLKAMLMTAYLNSRCADAR